MATKMKRLTVSRIRAAYRKIGRPAITGVSIGINGEVCPLVATYIASSGEDIRELDLNLIGDELGLTNQYIHDFISGVDDLLYLKNKRLGFKDGQAIRKSLIKKPINL